VYDPGVESRLLDVTVRTQSAILRAKRPEDVVAALERAVAELGGSLVPAHIAGDEVLHVDVGLGVRGPLLPWAPPDDPARPRLQHVLPGLVEDGQQMVHRLWRLAERSDPTLHDELTGALHPTATARLVARSRSGAVLLGVALDPTGATARIHGGTRMHRLLHELAVNVRSELDVDERLGRLHGLAVVAVLPRSDPDHAKTVLQRLDERWRRRDDTIDTPLRGAVTVVGEPPIDALAALREELGLATSNGGNPVEAR